MHTFYAVTECLGDANCWRTRTFFIQAPASQIVDRDRVATMPQQDRYCCQYHCYREYMVLEPVRLAVLC